LGCCPENLLASQTLLFFPVNIPFVSDYSARLVLERSDLVSHFILVIVLSFLWDYSLFGTCWFVHQFILVP